MFLYKCRGGALEQVRGLGHALGQQCLFIGTLFCLLCVFRFGHVCVCCVRGRRVEAGMGLGRAGALMPGC